jgi:hypothetical protein
MQYGMTAQTVTVGISFAIVRYTQRSRLLLYMVSVIHSKVKK